MPRLDYQPPHPLLRADNLKGREGLPYHPHPNLVGAANAALLIQQPLLITGDSGCGKTDFAFAAASGLGDHPLADERTNEVLECYVRSDSKARDLLYHYDAIRRFGDAQHGGEEGKKRAETPHPYLRLADLGLALMSPTLRVVLVDEIDKAPRDLPNDLLRELDQGHFEILEIADQPTTEAPLVDPEEPETFRRTMKRPNPDVRPLVIITSNVERQLPDPFLRRCVFFHIPFPDAEHLHQILRSRFGDDDSFIDKAIDIFGAARDFPMLTKKPTTAELIHWATVLRGLHGSGAATRALEALAGGPGKRAKGRHRELEWWNLPAMGCLIKLQEDQDRLCRARPR